MVRKKTHEEFLEEVKKYLGENYKALTIFQSSRDKIKMKHLTCGYIYEIRADRVKEGRKCKICSGFSKNIDVFKKQVFELVGSEYDVLGEYKNSNTKILFKHNECSHEYEATPNKFLNGRRCPKCFGNHKKTTEQYKKEVYDLVGDEYEVLGEYINAHDKIAIRHNNKECNFHISTITPAHFLFSNNRCAACFKNYKKTTEQFKQEVYNSLGNGYVLLSEYDGNKKKIKIRHENKNCNNYTWETLPYTILKGKGCPKCSGSMKKNTEIFKQEVEDKYSGEYKLLSSYASSKDRVKMKHILCGNIYNVTPAAFSSGAQCPKCRGGVKVTSEEYIEKLIELTDGEYEMVGTYVNASTHVEMRHNSEECSNRKWLVKPTVFLSGTRCPSCSGGSQLNTELYRVKLDKVYFGEIDIISEYTKSTNVATFIHKDGKCNYTWESTPQVLRQGHGCPKCNPSHGEFKIQKFLDSKNISYKVQFRFKNCRDKYPLPFDFVIARTKSDIAIEYDGEQHYREVNHFGGKKGFEDRQRRDQIKTQYCKDNNIKLIRIPYWDFDNIEDILNEELKDLISNNEDEVSA